VPSLSALNHATRYQHDANGNVIPTPIECPQVVGYDANGNAVLCQKNPDTNQYEVSSINDLLAQPQLVQERHLTIPYL